MKNDDYRYNILWADKIPPFCIAILHMLYPHSLIIARELCVVLKAIHISWLGEVYTTID